MRLWIALISVVLLFYSLPFTSGWAQPLRLGESPYVQDFDLAPGAQGDSLPAGWAAYSENGNLLPQLQVGNSGSNSPGAYNFAGQIGYICTGDTLNGAWYVLALQPQFNQREFELTFTVENVANSTTESAELRLEYSFQGPAQGFQPVPGVSQPVFNSSPFVQSPPRVTVQFDSSFNHRSQPLWLRWRFNRGTSIFGGSSDGLAIDSVELSWKTAVLNVDLGPDTLICGGGYTLRAPTLRNATYLWNTGAATPTLTPTASGTYAVEVRTDTALGADTVQLQLLLQPRPRAVLPGPTNEGLLRTGVLDNPDTVCAGGILDYSLPVAQPLTDEDYGQRFRYELVSLADSLGNGWQGGAALLAGTTNQPARLVLRPNEQDAGRLYRLVVRATSLPGGCDSLFGRWLRVPVAPLPPQPDSLPLCNNSAARLSLPPGQPSYAWYNIRQPNPVAINGPLVATAPATFYVRVDLPYCTYRDTVASVRINVNLNLGPDTTHCGPYTLRSNLPASQYRWSTGATTPSLTVQQSGSYSLEARTPGGCTVSDTAQVSILPLPVSTLAPFQRFCTNQTPRIRLNLDSIPQATTTARWLFQGDTLPETGFSLVAPQAGTYQLLLQRGPCQLLDTTEVLLYQAPSFTLGPDTVGCGTVTLIPQPLDTSWLYTWSTLSYDSVIQVKHSGQYALQVTNKANCKASDTLQVTLAEEVDFDFLPPSKVYVGQLVFFDFTASEPVAEWFWDFGNGKTANIRPRDQVFTTYPEPGTYVVEVRPVVENCGPRSVRKAIRVLPSPITSRPEAAPRPSLYPNPTARQTTLSGLPGAERPQVQLVSLLGQSVSGVQLAHLGADQWRVQWPALPQGLYLLKLRQGDQQWTYRLQVQSAVAR